MENGAITIFRKFAGNRLDTKDPLVQINGNTPAIIYFNTPMTGLSIEFIESFTIINNKNITSTFVFISQTGRPIIWAWEIITIEDLNFENATSTLVIDLSDTFYKAYERELVSYGIDKELIQFVNLATNGPYLFLNYRRSDRFNVYLFCGLQAHYDQNEKICVKHDEGSLNVELPILSTQKSYRNL